MKIDAQRDFVIEPTSKILFASNTFIGVPTILQYDNMPLVECVQSVAGPRTLRANLFSSSGDLLAIMKGAQLFKTKDGESAGLKLRYLQDATLCELGGKELLVVKRDGPVALALEAELHTFDGSLISCHTDVGGYLNAKDQGHLQIGGTIFRGNLIMGSPIGILVTSNGGVAMGASYAGVDDEASNVPEIVVRELGLLSRTIQSVDAN